RSCWGLGGVWTGVRRGARRAVQRSLLVRDRRASIRAPVLVRTGALVLRRFSVLLFCDIPGSRHLCRRPHASLTYWSSVGTLASSSNYRDRRALGWHSDCCDRSLLVALSWSRGDGRAFLHPLPAGRERDHEDPERQIFARLRPPIPRPRRRIYRPCASVKQQLS